MAAQGYDDLVHRVAIFGLSFGCGLALHVHCIRSAASRVVILLLFFMLQARAAIAIYTHTDQETLLDLNPTLYSSSFAASRPSHTSSPC